MYANIFTCIVRIKISAYINFREVEVLLYADDTVTKYTINDVVYFF